MPSAPQNLAIANGKSLEIHNTFVFCKALAFSLNVLIDWAHVPVSTLGKTFKTNKGPNGLKVMVNMYKQYKENNPNILKVYIDREEESISKMENEIIGGKYTLLASVESLARLGNTTEEDEAWEYLQELY